MQDLEYEIADDSHYLFAAGELSAKEEQFIEESKLKRMVSAYNIKELLKLIREGVESSPYCNKYVLPKKLPELLRFRQSYFKAVGSDLYAAGDRLIAVSDPDVHTEGLITLTKGSREELHAFVAQHRTRLQSVYTAGDMDIKDMETEPLSQAQKPLLNWKPDGIDPLFWLLDAGTKKQGDG